MANESKGNKNATATCIVQVMRLISLKLLKLATHEALNTDWGIATSHLSNMKKAKQRKWSKYKNSKANHHLTEYIKYCKENSLIF